jgi:hypothetical protein
MARKQRYTAEEVARALTSTKGLVYLAAKRLKCDPLTVNNYCKRYPSVRAARDAQRGEMVDLAEMKLYESIKHGEAWGIAFCLKTLGKDRGYVEQQKLALTDPSGEHGWEPTLGLATLLDAARKKLTPANGQPVPQLPEGEAAC